jgi:hypothetical protein
MPTQPETAKQPQGRCPRCGSTQAHRSRRRGLNERLLVLIGGRVRRCSGCGHRYISLGLLTLNAPDSRQVSRSLIWIILTVLGAAAVVVTMLWMTQRRDDGPPLDTSSLLHRPLAGYGRPAV